MDRPVQAESEESEDVVEPVSTHVEDSDGEAEEEPVVAAPVKKIIKKAVSEPVADAEVAEEPAAPKKKKVVKKATA